MKTKIPIALVYSRFVTGLVIVLLSILHVDNYKFFAITIFTFGLLTDIFDGIIARRLNISTQKLRRLDSTADQFFFSYLLVSQLISSARNFLKQMH